MVNNKLNRNTIILIGILLVLVYILYKLTKKEGYAYYRNYFPPTPCDDNLKKCINSTVSSGKLPNKADVLFKFPPNTSREIMVRHVANMFRTKADLAFTNVIDVMVERNGKGSSQYFNPHSEQSMRMNIDDENFEQVYIVLSVIKTRPSSITTPQVNHGIKIPLEFTSEGVVAKIDKAKSPKPIDYFLHYFFDPFYCEGRYEKELNVTGIDASNYNFVVSPKDIMDCRWENNDTKLESCKEYPKIVEVARQIAVEPDSDARVRKYVTPGQDINKCKVKEEYIKDWDARGVTVETEHHNIKLDQYINHPALFQNKLEGLYDDIFGMSRIIPSFPTGRSPSGRS
jgi:hypothetical protein